MPSKEALPPATLAAVYDELKALLGERATTEPFHRLAYSRDWSPRPATEDHLPQIVVIPHTTDEVAAIVRLAYAHSVPVTPFAGGTGMGGGCIPLQGGILVDTKGLQQILELDQDNLTVTTQTGITIHKLNEELAKHGLWFPHQPESKRASTVGAAIGCDNDSTFGIRYGKILEVLSNLVVVTGTGEVLRVGWRKASVSSTGYKLLPLFVGSEGTLGVVTEATLRIYAIPATREVRGYVCRSLADGLAATERLLNAGLAIDSAHLNCRARLHFYTHTYRQQHGHEPDVPAWAEAVLFVSFAGDQDVVQFSLAKAQAILSGEYHAEEIKEREIVDSWWASKHLVEFIPFKQKWPDSQRQKKFGAADLGLPFGRIEEAYHRFLDIAARWEQDVLGMTVYNESPNKVSPSISFAVFVDDTTPESAAKFHGYLREMSTMAVEMEGTMSSYIGDGDRLVGLNALEHGPSLAYMRRIKAMFDPKGIMNPGKKFATD